LDVDAVVTLPFDQDLAQVRAQAFVHQLITLARMSELWCGAEFALGYQREGTVPFLRALGETQGFTVRVLPPVTMDGEAISSTRIRQALRDGAVAQARRYLGAPYSLPGRVTRGKQRGRQIGFPTANLAIWEERAVPAVGVYACQARHGPHVSAAVVNIGLRPTFETGATVPTIEAHLLDFSGVLYAADLTLDFIDHLRPEMKFSGPAALRAQIEQDLVAARALLAAAPYQP
jgi:riboflavin kinase/FMN adenylyltransferase